MTTDLVNVMDEAREAAQGGLPEKFLERLADRIGNRATVKAVFGEPIVKGDLSVVPVAKVRWGFGGGSGSGSDASGQGGTASGSGGGGGVAADPVGYLEIRPDGATFRPIVSPYPSPMFLLASAFTAAIVLRGIGRIVRG